MVFVCAKLGIVGILKRAVSGVVKKLGFANCDGKSRNRGRDSAREGMKSSDLGGLTDRLAGVCDKREARERQVPEALPRLGLVGCAHVAKVGVRKAC